MSKFFISNNLIKLIEQSLHAQNTVRLCVPHLIFEVLCVINRETAVEAGVGSSKREVGSG